MRTSAITFAAAILLSAAAAQAQPEISRGEIVDIAISGVGSPYVWGGGCWDPADRSWRGADCSGYVGKCWQVPTRSEVTECSHPYSTYNFYNERTHWDAIGREELSTADAMVYRSGDSGHIVLWVSGDPWGNSEVYEARGTAYGIVHRTRTFDGSYQARRRHALIPDGPPPHPVLTLSAEIDTIDGQARDLCALSGSEGVFDAFAGQTITERFYVANEGTDAGQQVTVGLEMDPGDLQLLRWEVFDDWPSNACGGGWCRNDCNDLAANPPQDRPGEAITLHLGQLSPEETKMIVLELTVIGDSFAEGRTPTVRLWVSSIEGYYSKDSYAGAPSNVDDLQTFNGGDLRASTRHTLLDDELCNGVDDDCSGAADEGFGLGEACTAGLGACARQGLTVCSVGGGSTCDAVAGSPTTEICDNGVDDDCDGELDGDDETCGGDPDPPPPDGGVEEDGGVTEDAGDPGDAGPGTPPTRPGDGLTWVPSPLRGSCACDATGSSTGPLGGLLLALIASL